MTWICIQGSSNPHSIYSQSAALNLATSLNDSYCTLLFNSFFSCSNSIQILFEIQYWNWPSKQEKHGNIFTRQIFFQKRHCDFKSFKIMVFVKWTDNRAVTLIGSNVGNLNQISSILRPRNGASTSLAVTCPIIENKQNKIMGGAIFAINTFHYIILTEDPNFIFNSAYYVYVYHGKQLFYVS